jgi:hypothetical protein
MFPPCLAILLISGEPSKLLPIDDCSYADRTISGRRYDNVRFVYISMRKIYLLVIAQHIAEGMGDDDKFRGLLK